jgi:hypothetical protein
MFELSSRESFSVMPARTNPLDANFGICDYVLGKSHLPHKVHIKGLKSISFRSLNICLTSGFPTHQAKIFHEKFSRNQDNTNAGMAGMVALFTLIPHGMEDRR